MSYSEEQWALRMDWDQTGWCRFLPWEGALLWRMFCEATECEVDGDLDELVDWYSPLDPVAFGPDFFGGLDARVEHRRSWSDRRSLNRLFGKAGFVYPQTARQIAEVGRLLGLFMKKEEPRRWRAPAALPLPTEVLPMTPRQRQQEDEQRQHLLWSGPAAVIVEVLRDVGCPERVHTSVDELADLICEPSETVRQSLAFLNDTRFGGHLGRPLMKLQTAVAAGGNRSADPERLEGREEFQLVPNWQGLAATYGAVWEATHPGEEWSDTDER